MKKILLVLISVILTFQVVIQNIKIKQICDDVVIIELFKNEFIYNFDK